MSVARIAALCFLKVLMVSACLLSFYVTLVVTFYIPGGSTSERMLHTLILLSISLTVTLFTFLLFRKTK
jgi:hypothetical protein